MLFSLIIGVIVGVIAVVFALQNIAVVTVLFFAWQVQGSLALILLLAVAAGVLIALLIVLPETIRNYFRYRSLKRENAVLAEELRKQKDLALSSSRNTPVGIPDEEDH